MRSLLVGLAALVTSAGCGNDIERDHGDEPGECESDLEFFERKVWSQVMGKLCVRCHTLAGPAAEQNAKFLLQPPAYPGFLATNLENAAEVAKIHISGTSELLLKPTGRVAHGGGALIEVDSEEYRILQELIARTENPTACETTEAITFDDIVLLDGPRTLRKALLELASRIPTAAERNAMIAAGADGLDAALDQVLDQVMTESAFYDRMSELWNDVFLTDRFSAGSRAVATLNRTIWPLASTQLGASFLMLPAADQLRTNTAIAREPLELINYIIRTGKPFTEILTADYTVVNPYSAPIYNVAVEFTDPRNANEWREAKLTVPHRGQLVPWPHAGILSSPMWLNRFPTTPTNRNRHRARMIYRDFLATDILAIADRPIDAATATAFLNPTREDPTCKVCHSQLDPIAGSFQKFNAGDQEVWEPTTNWFPEMYPPGYDGEVMPASDFPRALPWLGTRVANDQRFAVAITRHVFKGLTGQTTLGYPAVDDPAFEAKRTAFTAQDTTLGAIANSFVASNFDLRVVIKAVIKTPYFRADTTYEPLDELRSVELADVGTARFATPERLARKLQAVTGAPWVRSDADRRDFLTTDYRIAFGGIDSDVVVDRLTTPNGIMSATSWRLANEVSCRMTAWDFTRPDNQRRLFPSVTINDAPESKGKPSPASKERIRAGLVHLHEQLLGETLAANDPEIERSYQLWLETWQEGEAELSAGLVSPMLMTACQVLTDRTTGVALPAAQQLKADPAYTIRAWMAVVTYLLADYRFLHN